jgi:hypothetical protein
MTRVSAKTQPILKCSGKPPLEWSGRLDGRLPGPGCKPPGKVIIESGGTQAAW